MENVAECEECECRNGATLDVLKEVQRAYEDRLQLLERVGGADKLQMQARVLRSWVSDLVAQNALLVRAVEELERETTSRAEAERRRHAEVRVWGSHCCFRTCPSRFQLASLPQIECELRAERAVLRRRLARKDADLRGLIEVLRRLRELDLCTLDGIHFFEVTHSDIFGDDGWLSLRKGDGGGHSGSGDDLASGSLKFTLCRIGNYNGMEKKNMNLELSLVNESLQNDVTAKDREMNSLKKDMQQYEQSLARVRCDGKPNVQMKDAEVMAGMCCTGAECGDLVPVQDLAERLREEAGKYRDRIRNMEISLQSSGVKLRAVHKLNLGLIEELSSLRRLVVAIDVERRDARVKLDLQRTIVKQMVRQLRQAKAQLKKKELDYSIKSDFVSGDNCGRPPSRASLPLPAPGARPPRPRRRDVPPPPPPPPHPLTDLLDSSGDFRPFHEDVQLSRKSN
ncbi:uncharacterized protein LOC134663369 [Cydia fagiglandana]|uniref:uncharacterized protein LOC134663369 n=1 Tax=Cydia fagiglandana TaxID=1458189 RepID=UPI002FEDF5A9